MWLGRAFSPIDHGELGRVGGQRVDGAVGLGITRTTVFNGRPMNVGVQYYYNVTRPDVAPVQQFRFILAFLYPEARRPQP